MKSIIEKAAVLIEALPYIQEFRGEIIVIKFGGSAMEDPRHVESVLADVSFMACVGMLPVLVHGGGKAISRRMREEGIESNFLHGLRVTCKESIRVVEDVIRNEVNAGIVNLLREKGCAAESTHGESIFRVIRKTGIDEQTGEALDWGFVGEPYEVDIEPIKECLAKGSVPVITPLGVGKDGQLHNINADTAAAAVAKALRARKLAFLSDVPGLLVDASDANSVVSTLSVNEVESLIEKGVISGGMLPKVGGGVDALHSGVKKIHMIDGRMQHSLLLEIFTDRGVGTEIIIGD